MACHSCQSLNFSCEIISNDNSPINDHYIYAFTNRIFLQIMGSIQMICFLLMMIVMLLQFHQFQALIQIFMMICNWQQTQWLAVTILVLIYTWKHYSLLVKQLLVSSIVYHACLNIFGIIIQTDSKNNSFLYVIFYMPLCFILY